MFKTKTPVEVGKGRYQHWGILGISGSGKGYATRGEVELRLDAGERVCIVDPKGDWWGLRVSADGKGTGYPVVVLGGKHADIAITPDSGAVIGEVIATGNLPAVIDVSQFESEAAKARFIVDFAKTLFAKNQRPLLLVLEEAHELAPQKPMGEQTKMLYWINKLLAQGRSLGLRIMLVSQRPAKIHKDSLTQCSGLVAMQAISAQDRAAIKDWVDGVGDPAKSREVMDSLATLPQGHGWAYHPGVRVLERVHFAEIATYDSGATPDGREVVDEPPGWSAINVDALTAAIKAATPPPEEAKGKKRRAAGDGAEPDGIPPSVLTDVRIELANVRGELESANAQLAQVRGELAAAEAKVNAMGPAEEELRRAANVALDAFYASIRGATIATAPKPDRAAVARTRSTMDRHFPGWEERIKGPRGPSKLPDELSGEPYRKIVNAIAWWSAIGIARPTKEQVAVIAGYKPGRNGTFDRYLTSLRSGGILAPDRGEYRLTDPNVADEIQTPGTLLELHERVKAVLPGVLWKVLSAVLHTREPQGRTAVAERAGYDLSGRNGTFDRYLTSLKSLGLIIAPKRTLVAPAPWLFPVTLTREVA